MHLNVYGGIWWKLGVTAYTTELYIAADTTELYILILV